MSTQEENAAEVAAIINRLKDEQEALLKQPDPSQHIYSGERTGLRNLWSSLVRKGLAYNRKKAATYGYSGDKASNNYSLTELGKEVRVVLLAPERDALKRAQHRYGYATIPVWMLLTSSIDGRKYMDERKRLEGVARAAGVPLMGGRELRRILAEAMELEADEQAAGGEG